eukprot:2958562-Pleurochrysis_carterae.AAC.2
MAGGGDATRLVWFPKVATTFPRLAPCGSNLWKGVEGSNLWKGVETLHSVPWQLTSQRVRSRPDHVMVPLRLSEGALVAWQHTFVGGTNLVGRQAHLLK